MRRIKVIINSESLLKPKTGIGYYIINLYKQLQKYPQLEITLTHFPKDRQLSYFIEKQTFFLKKFLKQKYPKKLAAFSYDILHFVFRLFSKTKQQLDPKSFDLYHEPNYSIIPSFNNIRRIAEIHDLAGINYPEWVDPRYHEMMKKNINALLESNRIIVKSHYIKNEIIAEYSIDPQKIDIIPNGLSLEDFQFLDKIQCKKYVNKIVKKPFLLFVGTIEPRKNLEFLFKAFKIIRNKYDIILVIAGKFGWGFEKIISLPITLNIQKHVIILGYTDETILKCLYIFAKIFVFPSLYEGFGIPPLEAMACKTPVIASNSSSIPEVVGDAALTFNPHDYEELAYLMEKVLTSEELSEKLRRKGLERVKHFSWEKTAKMTIESYKRALEE